MTDDVGYAGSQAFNQSLGSSESVNNATGSLSLRFSLVSLQGVTDLIPCQLALLYRADFPGVLGFPTGWQPDLPYIIPGVSLSLAGLSYALAPDWSDGNGHNSGLRYENNYGIELKDMVPPQALPNELGGTYAYFLTINDGSRFYFDSLGKLLLRLDRFGNGIVYTYADPEGGPLNTSLKTIVDSFGQTVTLTAGEAIGVTLPDGNSIAIAVSMTGVATLTDQIGEQTTIGYTTTAFGATVIEQISYPSGLTTNILYTEIVANLEQENTFYFPAVENITHTDASGLLDWTRYTYGANTGYTFTGANANLIYSFSYDCLMESNDHQYLYDCLVERLDTEGNQLSVSCTYFNFLHLAMQVDESLIGVAGSTVHRRTLLTYDLADDITQLSASYAQPIQVDLLVWSDMQATFLPRSRTKTLYNDYAQILSSQVFCVTASGGALVPQLSSVYQYQSAWSGIQPGSMIASATEADLVAATVRTTTYLLTEDATAIASEMSSFQQDTGPAAPWKSRTYTYDSFGRLTSATLQWASQSGQAGITSTSNTYAYAFNSTQALLTVSVTDPLGRTSQRTFRRDLPGDCLVSVTDAIGTTSSIDRDALGRPVRCIDADGNVTAITYSTLATGQYNGWAVQSPLGYVQTHVLNGMSRETALTDNGGADGGQRTIRSRNVDMRGMTASTTDVCGLITVYQYDALGRMVGRSDPVGNATQFAYNEDTNSVVATLNGTVVSSRMFDGLGRELLRCSFPAGESTLDAIAQATNYTGAGRVAAATFGIYEATTSAIGTPLQAITLNYDGDGRLTLTKRQSLPVPGDATTSNWTRDLLGNALQQDLNVTYADGSHFSSKTDLKNYDAAGQLTSIVNATGGRKLFQYDGAGRLASTTDIDGTVVTYTRDANGDVVTTSAGEINLSASLDADRRVVSLSEAGVSMSFSYAIDGSLTSLDFGDGCRQTYQRDGCGRTIAATDAAGSTTTYTYSAQGLVTQAALGDDGVTLSYGLVGPAYGGLTGEASGTSWTRIYGYDGYGRLISISTVGASGNAETDLSYDDRSRLIGLQRSTVTGATAYSYDGLNQLVSEQSSGGATTSYGYDGAANVTRQSVDGVNTALTYDALNQLVQTGVTFDARGNMVSDAAGAQYSYDALNRLVGIQPAANDAITLGYHPNGLLATVTQGGSAKHLYYDGRQCNAVISDESSGDSTSTSFLLLGSRRLLASSSDTGPTYYETANGSTVALFGAETAELTYSAYGMRTDGGSDSVAAAFGWKQEYALPGTGLVYLRARFFDPATMRFLSADQYVTDNRYVYGRGDPANHFDPSGRISTENLIGNITEIVLSIGAVVAAPFTAGMSVLSLDFGIIAAGGLLGAAGGGLGLAAGATDSRRLRIASWVLMIASVAVGVFGYGRVIYGSLAGAAEGERAIAPAIELEDRAPVVGDGPAGGGAPEPARVDASLEPRAAVAEASVETDVRPPPSDAESQVGEALRADEEGSASSSSSEAVAPGERAPPGQNADIPAFVAPPQNIFSIWPREPYEFNSVRKLLEASATDSTFTNARLILRFNADPPPYLTDFLNLPGTIKR